MRELKRAAVESSLVFAGFVIISCPLKPTSKNAIKEIQNSSHHVRVDLDINNTCADKQPEVCYEYRLMT